MYMTEYGLKASKQEQREQAKQGNINFYRKLCRMLDVEIDSQMEIISMMSDTASVLVNRFGMSYDEIEQIELEEMC